MKKTAILFFAFVLCALASVAQDKPQSPAKTASETVAGTKITLTYGAPSVRGRKIWGALVPYKKVWRTGANDATTFTVDKDVKIEGKKLAAGTYSLFTIPDAKEWVIIFNSEAKQWGHYSYSDKKDVLRVTVKSSKAKTLTEEMTFVVGKDGVVSLMWENTKVDFKVSQ